MSQLVLNLSIQFFSYSEMINSNILGWSYWSRNPNSGQITRSSEQKKAGAYSAKLILTPPLGPIKDDDYDNQIGQDGIRLQDQ